MIDHLRCKRTLIQSSFFLSCLQDFLRLFCLCRHKKYRFFLIFYMISINLVLQDLPFMRMNIAKYSASGKKHESTQNSCHFPLLSCQKCIHSSPFFRFSLFFFCQIQPFLAPDGPCCSEPDGQWFTFHPKLFRQCIKSEAAFAGICLNFMPECMIYPGADRGPAADRAYPALPQEMFCPPRIFPCQAFIENL